MSNQPNRLAWTGLGNIGRGMAKNIIQKGTYTGPLLLHNRTVSKAESFAATFDAGKAKAASSITDCVDNADIVFLCVADDASVEETLTAALKSPAAKGTLFVDCSTIHPDTTNRMQTLVESSGAHFVACPVFGAPPMAEGGTLINVLAGPKPQIDRVLPFCTDVTARAVVNFSDQPCGNATRMKIVGNTFILNMINTLSEGHVLAEKSGLGTENLHAWIEQMFPGPYTAYSNRLMSGDYYQREYPAFTAKLARKDYRHAKALADGCGAKMRGLDVGGQRLQDVVDYAGDKGDIAGIYGAARRESGLDFENQGKK